MNKKDIIFLLHQYKGKDYVDIYPFNTDNRKIEAFFRDIVEKVEEQQKAHKQLETQLNQKIEEYVNTSKSDLDAHMKDAVKHITSSERSAWNAKETPSAAQAKATKALEDAKVYTDTHSNRTDNPHKVTKSQIGLGKVANYEVATKAEAEAGTSNNTYMTALRVVESIAKNESVSSVQGKKGDVQFSTDLHDDITWIEANAFDADAFPEEYPTGVSAFRTTLTGQDGWNELTGSKIKNVRYLILTFNDGAVKSNYYQFIVRMRTPGNYSTTYEGTWVRTAFNGNGSWNGPIKILNQGDLSDLTTSNSSDTIATSKAVKDTMDVAKAAQQRADEAFTLGVKQKQATVDSLTSIGASLLSDPTWGEIQAEIKNADYTRYAEVSLGAGQKSAILSFYPEALSGIYPGLTGGHPRHYVLDYGKGNVKIIYEDGSPDTFYRITINGRKIELSEPLDVWINLKVWGVAEK